MQSPGGIWDAAGPAERRLAGVALNPSASEDVLLRLLADNSPAVRMVLCRDRVLPDAVVEAALKHPDTYTRSFFARNPHVDPAQRARLMDDPEWFVRAHLTEAPRASLGVPIRPLPDQAVVHMISTYDNEALGGSFFRQISMGLKRSMPTHPVAKVRRWGVGSWDHLYADTRAALLADPDEEVREYALMYAQRDDPATSDLTFLEGALHKRGYGLMRQALSRAIADSALADPDETNRVLIAPNPSLPADVVVRLAADPDPKVREAVAGRPDLGPAERRALAVDPDPKVRLALSAHPALSEEERAAIDYEVPIDGCFHYIPEPYVLPNPEDVRRDALSGHPMLRRKAAIDHSLPPDLVARLAEDDDLGVRVLLAQNHPDAPARLLLRSFLEYTGHSRQDLTDRPNFPTTGLAVHADHEDPEVRALTARDPEAAPTTVERLTHDPDPVIRAAMARHPRLPRPRLMELLDDEELAHPAAANPALPQETIRRLLSGRQ
ncbi:hypothetical protein [Streptomyces milbemycinicus]|uniref:hypothetical protein n=1 Tax=Streptomyces milbemycinicus TaxID=476552 RepID=UPI0033EE771B